MFSLWAVLIAIGIIAKRVYGHPDWMVFFHLPAAVCLVMGFYHLSYKVRQRHLLDSQKIHESLSLRSR
jgi:hypothetical protein